MTGRTLGDIALELGGELLGPGEMAITGYGGLEDAGPDELSFVNSLSLGAAAGKSKAGALLVPPGFEPDRPAVRVEDPHGAFVRLLERIAPDPDLLFPPGVHPTAVIDGDADVAGADAIGPCCVIGPGVQLGPGTRLGAHVVLERDVVLGSGCLVYSQVTVRYGCRLGNRVILHPGVVIGSDGFGFLPGPEGMTKIPQVGIVVLEDDVEVGAGSCIDRAKAGRTVIGTGTKIDNLVQIGHNVKIGAHCALSAQVGIAGTVVLGDGVFAGGQVGIADHLEVGPGAQLAGKSGIWRDVPAGETVFGYPALNIKEAFRITSAMRRLPDLIKRWRTLDAGDDKQREQK